MPCVAIGNGAIIDRIHRRWSISAAELIGGIVQAGANGVVTWPVTSHRNPALIGWHQHPLGEPVEIGAADSFGGPWCSLMINDVAAAPGPIRVAA